MEYKNEERARTKKIARKAKKAWVIISSIIAGGIIFLIAVGYLIELSEENKWITPSTKHRTGLPVNPEIMALINSGQFISYSDIKTESWRLLIREPILWRKSVADFYELTGVLVYLYSSEKADYTKEEINKLYINAFGDPEFSGANMLVIISRDYDNSANQNDFLMGLKAAEFMDSEATAILMDAMYNPWAFNTQDGWRCRQSSALTEAGKRMMSPTKNRAVPVGLAMLAVVVLIFVVIIIWKKQHKKDEEIYRILNTSLEKLADESGEQEKEQTE